MVIHWIKNKKLQSTRKINENTTLDVSSVKIKHNITKAELLVQY